MAHAGLKPALALTDLLLRYPNFGTRESDPAIRRMMSGH
jgi:hypothetical protein